MKTCLVKISYILYIYRIYCIYIYCIYCIYIAYMYIMHDDCKKRIVAKVNQDNSNSWNILDRIHKRDDNIFLQRNILLLFLLLLLLSILLLLLFLSEFFSWTLTTHGTSGEGRAPSFIPLYHFHPLKNIQTLICTFACEMIYFSWVVFHVTDTSPWLLKSTSSEVYPNYFLLHSFLRNTASETTVGTLLLIVQHLRYLQDFIQHH